MFGGFTGESDDEGSSGGQSAGIAAGGGGGGDDWGINEDPGYQAKQDNSFDPAQQASQDAYKGAAQINSESNSGRQVAEGIGRTAGLFSAIEGMVGPRQKRLRKSQRVFARAQAQFQIDQANRALTQYRADSQIQEQKLSQSYAGRGIGYSSIQTEGMQYYHDTVERTMQGLAQQVALAQSNQRLVKSQISASYANTWTSFGNSLAAMV